jgi:hypothetical protein
MKSLNKRDKACRTLISGLYIHLDTQRQGCNHGRRGATKRKLCRVCVTWWQRKNYNGTLFWEAAVTNRGGSAILDSGAPEHQGRRSEELQSRRQRSSGDATSWSDSSSRNSSHQSHDDGRRELVVGSTQTFR